MSPPQLQSPRSAGDSPDTDRNVHLDDPQGRRHQNQHGGTSCERCKRLKSRCGRQRPSCSRCLDAAADCQYADRRRPGFPAGYRQGLEAKIRRLEAELTILRTAAAGPALPEAVAPQPLLVQRPLQSLSSPPQPGDGADGYDHVQATSQRTRRVPERIPPPDLVCALVALYFRHVHPWLPLLDAERVLAGLACRGDPPLLCYALFAVALPFSFDSRLARASADSYWKYVKRRILIEVLEEPSYAALEALSILVLDLSGMTHGPQVWGALAVAVKLASQLRTADDRVLRVGTSDGDADNEDENQRGSKNASNLNKNRTASSTRRVVDRVGRRRLFWTIYSLDCYISMAGSQPGLTAESHFQHFLPSRAETWEAGHGSDSNRISPANVFFQQLRLLDVARQTHALFLKYVQVQVGQPSLQPDATWLHDFIACSVALDEWRSSLPAELNTALDSPGLRPRSPAISALTTLAAYYHAVRIYLHSMRPLMSTPLQQHTPPSSAGTRPMTTAPTSSQEQCTKAIEALLQILGAVHMDTYDKLGWPFSWTVWVATRYTLFVGYQAVAVSQQAVQSPNTIRSTATTTGTGAGDSTIFVGGSSATSDKTSSTISHQQPTPYALNSGPHPQMSASSLLPNLEKLITGLETTARYQQVSGKYLWLACQAREELLTLISHGGGLASPGGVLHYLVDLRVATSDLEDRFRCDPFFDDSSDQTSFQQEQQEQREQQERQQQQQQQQQRQLLQPESQQQTQQFYGGVVQPQHQYTLPCAGPPQQQHLPNNQTANSQFLHYGLLSEQVCEDSEMCNGNQVSLYEHHHQQQQEEQYRNHSGDHNDTTFGMPSGGPDDLWYQAPLRPSSAFPPYPFQES